MRFKQFSVDDARCAMKVGTDGILLGAWVSCEGAGKLLDIGTGSGLIALMAAQRCAAGGDHRFYITAIDIDGEAAAQAADNFAASPWAGQMKALPTSLDAFVAEGHDGEFDVIVSNPPYYIAGKSIVPAGEQRTAARRDADLTLDDILQAASRLLSPNGRLSLILPTAREADLLASMEKYGFSATRICRVKTTERKEPSRVLVEIGRISCSPPWGSGAAARGLEKIVPCAAPLSPLAEGLTIGSEEFRKLTGNYYL